MGSAIGDFERIGDHAVNMLGVAREISDKGISFSKSACAEIKVLESALEEIVALTVSAFAEKDLGKAKDVEPLEQVVDGLKARMRNSHITRLQNGECSIEAGFVWADLITNLERTSDHCSNIAGCIIEAANNEMTVHEALRDIRSDSPDYWDKYKNYLEKYSSKSEKDLQKINFDVAIDFIKS